MRADLSSGEVAKREALSCRLLAFGIRTALRLERKTPRSYLQTPHPLSASGDQPVRGRGPGPAGEERREAAEEQRGAGEDPRRQDLMISSGPGPQATRRCGRHKDYSASKYSGKYLKHGSKRATYNVF